METEVETQPLNGYMEKREMEMKWKLETETGNGNRGGNTTS